MKQIIEDLYPMNAGLLGEGYDNRLEYIKKLIDLEMYTFPSGTEVGSWTVPEEWVVRDAYVKYKGKKVIDYQKQPLSLIVGSLPFSGTVTKEELFTHLHYAEDMPDEYLYEFKFYEKDWGFTVPKNKLDSFKDGEYEVFIDTEYRLGAMKVATHTIPGKTDREVLLFAHLDHPFQANDNLSAVAALVDIVNKVKPKQYEHTIKLVFCPETIGSVAYALTVPQDKVDFVIALDIVGNENEEGILLQRSYDKENYINDIAHLALRGMGTRYRQAGFRQVIGSDEYAYNDPAIGIPGLLFTTHPYDEYHTAADTPEKINYEMIERVQKAVLKTIDYAEKDFIPERTIAGPLHRSKFKIQSLGKQLNLSWDYLWYGMDGKTRLSKLCLELGLNYEHTYEHIEQLLKAGYIRKA